MEIEMELDVLTAEDIATQAQCSSRSVRRAAIEDDRMPSPVMIGGVRVWRRSHLASILKIIAERRARRGTYARESSVEQLAATA